MSKPIVSIRNLTKSYRLYSNSSDRLKELLFPWRSWHSDFFALQDITFDLYPSEHLGVIGRNGAGKSTLLQIISGVLTQTSGTVDIKGNVSALLELAVGFNPELTGRENVEFLASTLNSGRKIPKNSVDKIIAFADIGDFIDQPVKTYSSGMFVRLGFAMNIIHAPDILIIDEALAVGDIVFQQKCMRSLAEFCNRGTVIFVSHDPASVKKICNRALWLENGQVKAFGDAKEVCDQYVGASNEEFGRNYVDNSSRQAEVEEPQEEQQQTVEGQQLVVLDGVEQFIKDAQKPTLERVRRTIELCMDKYSGSFENRESIGTKEVIICHASIERQSDDSNLIFEGGESCQLVVYLRAKKNVPQAVVGFIVKDRLGQFFLGLNSLDCQVSIELIPSKIYAIVFEFELPKIANGIYTIDLAVAEGDLENHRQLHWVYDALQFQVDREDYRGVMVEPDNVCVYIID